MLGAVRASVPVQSGFLAVSNWHSKFPHLELHCYTTAAASCTTRHGHLGIGRHVKHDHTLVGTILPLASHRLRSRISYMAAGPVSVCSQMAAVLCCAVLLASLCCTNLRSLLLAINEQHAPHCVSSQHPSTSRLCLVEYGMHLDCMLAD